MRALAFILIVCLISCSKRQSLDGHWVSKEFFEGKPFFTADFCQGDSLIIFNKNSLGQNFGASYFVEEGKGEFFFAHSSTGSFELNDDSLTISSDGFGSTLVKIDHSKTFHKSLFIGISLHIDLPEIKESDSAFIYSEPVDVVDISIGYPILGLENKFPDSTFIQVQDIYLPEQELPSFINRAMDGFPEAVRNDVIIRINADDNISVEFLRRIVLHSKDHKVWRTYLDRSRNKLGYEQLSGELQ
jgi:hypothetical protein